MCAPHNSSKYLINWKLEPNQTEFQITWSLSFPHDFHKKVGNYKKKKNTHKKTAIYLKQKTSWTYLQASTYQTNCLYSVHLK